MIKQIPCMCFFLLLGCCVVFADGQKTYDSARIPFDGLTGTMDDFLMSKPKARLRLGSLYFNPDDFLEQDMAHIFNCDDAIDKYLTDNAEGYYEQLAAVLEERITDNIKDKSAFGRVIVDASEKDNIIVISFMVHLVKSVVLPIYADAVNSDVKASTSIACAIEYNVSFELTVDSDKVNKNETLAGTSLRLDEYSLEIKPIEDALDTNATVVYKDTFYQMPLSEHTVTAYFNWIIAGESEISDERPSLSYEQLSKGEYQWEAGANAHLAITGEWANPDPDDDTKLELSFDVYDSTSPEYQAINITDDEGTKEFAIKSLQN